MTQTILQSVKAIKSFFNNNGHKTDEADVKNKLQYLDLFFRYGFLFQLLERNKNS